MMQFFVFMEQNFEAVEEDSNDQNPKTPLKLNLNLMSKNWIVCLVSLLAAAVVQALDYQDNIYIVLSSSKFFFNYRHSLNAF